MLKTTTVLFEFHVFSVSLQLSHSVGVNTVHRYTIRVGQRNGRRMGMRLATCKKGCSGGTREGASEQSFVSIVLIKCFMLLTTSLKNLCIFQWFRGQIFNYNNSRCVTPSCASCTHLLFETTDVPIVDFAPVLQTNSL